MQYQSNKEADMWMYLDQVEERYQETPAHIQESFDEIGDVFEVMEEIAKTPEGLRSLVNRYSHTPSRHVWTYLAATVGAAVFAALDEHPRNENKLDEAVNLYFKLFTDVRWLVIPPDMLMGMLGVVYRVIESGYWENKKTPAILYDVLQRSLTFGWGVRVRADYVRLAAIDLLSLLCKTDLLGRDFSQPQITWLQQEVIYFARNQETNDAFELEEATTSKSRFVECLKTKNLIYGENNLV